MPEPASLKLRIWPAILAAPPRLARLVRDTYGRRRWQGFAPSAQDQEVFEAAEQANTSTAAIARLGIAVVFAALLFGFASRNLDSFDLAAALVLVNLGLSVLGLLLVRWRRLRRALPYVLALLDVGFILSVVASYPHQPSALPSAFRSALIATWGIFLALALSVVRGSPGILALQTLLFSGGFLITVLLEPSTAFGGTPLEPAIKLLFGTGYDAMRALIVLLTGGVLVVAALRARTNLRHAIAGSRRAASLARYLAPAVAEIVADTEVAALRRGRQQNMAILFADVRDFTSMSEALTPHEIAAFLNQFRARATEAIGQKGGVIDKFIGDEVMGLFGLPLATPDDAANAVAAGRALLQSLAAWNAERATQGLAPVGVGVGIHYGPVFVGVLGEERLEFTVLGDTVNVARRLEQAAKAVGQNFLVSAQVLEAAGTGFCAGRRWVPLPSGPIRGHREPVLTYAEVLDESTMAD